MAREVARRAAQWTVVSYVGAESVADQIRALEADASMTYLMGAMQDDILEVEVGRPH